MSEAKSVTLFKSRQGNCRLAMPDGELIHFVNGRYFTEDPEVEEFLKVQAAHPKTGIYIDTKETSIVPSEATPMAQMRKKIIEEYLAEQANVKDAGVSDTSGAPGSVAGTDESGLNNSGALAAIKAAQAGQGATTVHPVEAKQKAAISGKK